MTKLRKTNADGLSEAFSLEVGGDPVKVVERVYRTGREFPTQKPHADAPTRTATPMVQHPEPKGWELDAKGNSPVCQSREESPAPNSTGDTKGWLRGMGSPHPYYDGGKSGTRYSGGKK